MYMFKNLMEGGTRKETTIKSYESRLKTLNNGKEVDNLAFLYNYDGILEKIQKYKPTTQRNFIIAIVSVLKPIKVMKSMYDKYSKLLEEYNTELKTNNYKSETQKDNWIDQDEVVKVYEKLYEDVYPILCNPKDTRSVNKKNNITEKDFNKITQLILLSLFVVQQPRRLLDYLNMVVVKKVSKDMDNSLNYYDITNSKMYFNNYKTASTYNTQEVDVPEKLQQLLKCYVNIHPEKLTSKNKIYLLCNYDGSKINNVSTLTRILNKIFMNACGKRISSNLLRNIYLTNEFKPQISKLETTAYNMGTSPDMIKNVYVKQD
jgi:hypothetical protein